METANREIIEKKVYEEGKKSYATKGEALGVGIPALVLGGLSAAALWGRGNRLSIGGGMPENVNINTATGGAGSGVAPTAFQAWEKSCEDTIELTNAMWRLKVGSMQADYDHRNTDVAEKFSIYKSQADADFGLYKVSRDLYDNMNDKLNAASFGLYKEGRDNYDKLSARLCQLEKEVAIGAAIRPYQDKLIQCEIEKAYTAGINYTDRLDFRNIKGIITLPNAPTVTGFPSQCCGCRTTAGTGSVSGSAA